MQGCKESPPSKERKGEFEFGDTGVRVHLARGSIVHWLSREFGICFRINLSGTSPVFRMPFLLFLSFSLSLSLVLSLSVGATNRNAVQEQTLLYHSLCFRHSISKRKLRARPKKSRPKEVINFEHVLCSQSAETCVGQVGAKWLPIGSAEEG